jgi:hypothetical protein
VTRRLVLAGTSVLQLASATCALHYAVERGLAVHAVGIHRRGHDVPRDSWLLGTGITPPLVMMAVQAVASTVVARRPSRVAVHTLGVLGALMVVGYAVERETRTALLPARWDSRVTPLTVAGVALAVPMARLGLQAGWARSVVGDTECSP